MGSFSDSIQATISKQLAQVNSSCNAVATKAFTHVVDFSPMGNKANRDAPFADGLLINQWYVSNDSPSTKLSSAKSDSGSGSLSRIAVVATSKTFLNKDGKLFLTNNTPYVGLAETTGWLPSINPAWKGAKPFAMVERAIIATKAEL
jgi:hypothetical protein